jgi:hypothetical protein
MKRIPEHPSYKIDRLGIVTKNDRPVGLTIDDGNIIRFRVMSRGVVTYYRLDEMILRLYRGLIKGDYSEIIHLDGDRTNNEIDNIHPVMVDMTPGVCYDPNKEIWRVYSTSSTSTIDRHTQRSLGSFNSRRDAIAFKHSFDRSCLKQMA